MDTKILVVGNGWLGNIIREYLGAEITDKRIEQLIESGDTTLVGYDVVINTASKTNIDWCEQNKEECYASNAAGALDLYRKCNGLRIKYVYISSACIFQSADIDDVKNEEAQPDPQCYYAKTKWLAETYLAHTNALILRIRVPVSFKPHARNTLSKLLSYDKLVDSQESMTVIEDFLPIMRDLIKSHAWGIYNMVNEGTISPSEIGDIFNHPHTRLTKQEFDAMIAGSGRTKRVTTVVGSKRIPLMPNIRERILEIKNNWA